MDHRKALLMRDSSPALPPAHPYFAKMVELLNEIQRSGGGEAAVSYANGQILGLEQIREQMMIPGTMSHRIAETQEIEPDDMNQMIRYLKVRIAGFRVLAN